MSLPCLIATCQQAGWSCHGLGWGYRNPRVQKDLWHETTSAGATPGLALLRLDRVGGIPQQKPASLSVAAQTRTPLARIIHDEVEPGWGIGRQRRRASRRRAVNQVGCGLCGPTNDLRGLDPPCQFDPLCQLGGGAILLRKGVTPLLHTADCERGSRNNRLPCLAVDGQRGARTQRRWQPFARRMPLPPVRWRQG